MTTTAGRTSPSASAAAAATAAADESESDDSSSSTSSSSSSSTLPLALPAYHREEGRFHHTCNPFAAILSLDQVAEIVTHLTLPERCRFRSTCRHVRRAQAIVDGTGTTRLSHPAGHDLRQLCRPAAATVGASPHWLEDVEALRRSRSALLGRFAALRHLDVGTLATNEFLRLLSSPHMHNIMCSHESGISAASGDDNDDGCGNAVGERPSQQQELPSEPPPTPPRGELLLPNLETLSMEGSREVNDAGILWLGQRAAILADDAGTSSGTHLRQLNITFCPKISYGATLKLRCKFPEPLVIRRQPEWLDGHFETPFAGGGVATEIHTYYPDGSFRFTRSQQSAGFVAQLFRWSDRLASGGGGCDVGLQNDTLRSSLSDDSDSHDDFLGDKLQYIDFDAREWPGWTRFAYRPGVSLRRLPDECVVGKNGKKEITRSVLVAQCRRGYRPPSNFPKLGQQDDIPLNETRYFMDDGSTIPEYDPSEDDGTSGQVVMVSKMKVRPLLSNEMVPPTDLLGQIGAFIEEMSSTDIPPNGEDVINSVLGGLVGTDDD